MDALLVAAAVVAILVVVLMRKQNLGKPVTPVRHDASSRIDFAPTSNVLLGETTDAGTPSIAYARFSARFQALIIDGLIVLFGVVGAAVAFATLGTSGTFGAIFGLSLLGAVLLYEPILVWQRGGTIGHQLKNLRVVSGHTGGNPRFLQAVARMFLKGVLGVFSFVTMPLTRRHQAIHDRLTDTTVQVRDASFADAADFAPEQDIEVAGMPSKGRRVVAIVVYAFLWFAAMTVVGVFTYSSDCSLREVCTEGEKALQSLIGFVLMGGWAGCIILGWKGILWGARPQTGVGEGR